MKKNCNKITRWGDTKSLIEDFGKFILSPERITMDEKKISLISEMTNYLKTTDEQRKSEILYWMILSVHKKTQKLFIKDVLNCIFNIRQLKKTRISKKRKLLLRLLEDNYLGFVYNLETGFFKEVFTKIPYSSIFNDFIKKDLICSEPTIIVKGLFYFFDKNKENRRIINEKIKNNNFCIYLFELFKIEIVRNGNFLNRLENLFDIEKSNAEFEKESIKKEIRGNSVFKITQRF